MIHSVGQYMSAKRPCPEIIVFNDPSKRKKVNWIKLANSWVLSSHYYIGLPCLY